MSVPKDPIVIARGLKKHYRTKGGILHAVDGVDLSIAKGSTLGVVGESGCGKTTLGRTLLNLVPATSGQILFDGESVRDCSQARMKELRKDMQIIFQDPYASLDPRMSVLEAVAEPLLVNGPRMKAVERRELALGVMDRVGLSRNLVDVYPHELDGGRRQRIGVARALALKPRFIVCDEPVSALDVSIQAQILNLMMDLQDEMMLTYLFISHNLAVVRHISDVVAVMYLGQIVEVCPPDEIFAAPHHQYTRALLAAIPLPDLSRRGRPRQIIRGELKSPVNPAPGCRFADRCPIVMERCREADPPLREVSPGHWSACVSDMG